MAAPSGLGMPSNTLVDSAGETTNGGSKSSQLDKQTLLAVLQFLKKNELKV